MLNHHSRQLHISLWVIFSLGMVANAWAGELTIQVNDMAGAPISDAVVYAEANNKVPGQPVGTAAIEQKNRQFMPLVTVIQTGSSITFPNKDTVRHHVYSFSPTKTFELKLYSGVPTVPVVFDKPGTVVLGCNIHDQMLAFVHVVDTPYFGKTDASGKVKLSDLPNGQYVVKAWHYASVKENVVVEQPLNVKGSEQVAMKIDIQSSSLRKP
ncbi:MAG TPA: methylamine utilization protein [Methylophilaceae bacterium]|nr:methylamine utilization protein [Methylophilaceae bacterium]